MKPLIIVEVALLQNISFLVILMYDEKGNQCEQQSLPYEDDNQVLKRIDRLKESYRVQSLDVWTSNKDIFRLLFDKAGILCFIKHPDDTKICQSVLDTDRELIMDIYNIGIDGYKRRLPRWRQLLARWLKVVLKIIEGNGKYEI
ncbi:MAG: hypothetical protein ACE3JK_01500 [Sporolactobacillus sp.]